MGPMVASTPQREGSAERRGRSQCHEKEGRAQRPVSLRQRQKVQNVLWPLSGGSVGHASGLLIQV